MKIFAHRGWAEGEIENTLLAFEKSANAGFDGVEFDVRYGADGKTIVLSHDPGDTLAPSLEDALQYLKSTNLELLIELKEYSDDFFVLLTQQLRKFDLVDRTTIFAFPEICTHFPWKLRQDIRLGIIAPYPGDIKKCIEKYNPDMVLMGWGNKKERLQFKFAWSMLSLAKTFAKYPAVKFIVGVAYKEGDKHWLSKKKGLHGFTADMPLL